MALRAECHGRSTAFALVVAGAVVAAAIDSRPAGAGTRPGVIGRGLTRTVAVATVLTALSAGLVALAAQLRCGRPFALARPAMVGPRPRCDVSHLTPHEQRVLRCLHRGGRIGP
jgi:hypothetical protein